MTNVKGTTDYRGGEQRLRNRLRFVLERQFALYDFEPAETPILNEQSLLAAKYAGGEEILHEMYRLSDQRGRKLALRYDLTVPFAKIVAADPGLEFPYKRYEIGKVFRDGPVKRGRMREFTQCDADVAGAGGPEVEAELLQLACDVFRELGVEIVVRWNNRRFLGDLLGRFGIGEALQMPVMLTLDKLDKIGVEGVAEELAGRQLNPEAAGTLVGLLNGPAPTFEELVDRFGLSDSAGADEVAKLRRLLKDTGLGTVCRFDCFLSRGLSFYTGTVYELFAADGSYQSSLGSGGRYDTIIGKLAGSVETAIPAVGISFGLDSVMEVWRAKGAADESPIVRLIPIGDTAAQSLRAAARFRAAGIRCRVENGARKLKRTLAAAAAKGTRFAVLIGEAEVADGVVRVKDMRTGEQTVVPLEQAIYWIETGLD